MVIAVYGATGYTGRLVAHELRRRGLEMRLCGRSEDKLGRLAADLGGDVETRTAGVDDSPRLRAAFAGADVVLSCAGPFTYFGGPVIDAALSAGAHCCDTTGEQSYMLGVFEHLDRPAREAGRAVVPGVGFDYVPGDLIAALAARGHEPLRELVMAYAVNGLGMTRGTMHSALEMLRGGDVEYAGGAWVPAGRTALRDTFDFGGERGVQPVAKYPGGEIVTVPRHVSTRAVRERMTTSTFAPNPRLAGAVAGASIALGVLLSTPLRGPIDALIDRLPEGPSEEARRASRFTIVAEAHGEDGSTSRASVHGSDVYGLTAVMAVEIARRLAESAPGALSGALAPSQVADPEELLGWLGDHGVTYEA